MNCQEINHLLDVHDNALTAGQRAAVDGHLGTCRACRTEWANWDAVAALPIAPLPAELRGRIAVALAVRDTPAPRRAFRPLVICGLLLGGAALAAAVAWMRPGRTVEPAAIIAADARRIEPARPSDVEVATRPAEAGNAHDPTEPAATTGAVSLDRHRVLVLLQKEEVADAEALDLVFRCRDGAVREVQALGGVQLIVDPGVHPFEVFEPIEGISPEVADRARSQGAGSVLTFSTELVCSATLYSTETGESLWGAGMGDPPDPYERVAEFGTGVGTKVHDLTLQDPSSAQSEARAALLNRALDDGSRASALWDLLPGGYRNDDADLLRRILDSEVIAAAIGIASESPDADARGSVWAVLRGVADPALVQPLLKSLANDPDSGVRYQAALNLNSFLDQPGVREGLLRAAAQDPDAEPTVGCCLYTVREAAQRALVPTEELGNWALATLRDASLPARWRLMTLQPVTPDGRFQRFPEPGFDIDSAHIVFDIGRSSSDANARAMAWKALWGAPHEATFIPVLVGDLANFPDATVRYAAARALQAHRGNPEVRAALERALEDSSIDVRRAAAEALSPLHLD